MRKIVLIKRAVQKMSLSWNSHIKVHRSNEVPFWGQKWKIWTLPESNFISFFSLQFTLCFQRTLSQMIQTHFKEKLKYFCYLMEITSFYHLKWFVYSLPIESSYFNLLSCLDKLKFMNHMHSFLYFLNWICYLGLLLNMHGDRRHVC